MQRDASDGNCLWRCFGSKKQLRRLVRQEEKLRETFSGRPFFVHSLLVPVITGCARIGMVAVLYGGSGGFTMRETRDLLAESVEKDDSRHAEHTHTRAHIRKEFSRPFFSPHTHISLSVCMNVCACACICAEWDAIRADIRFSGTPPGLTAPPPPAVFPRLPRGLPSM